MPILGREREMKEGERDAPLALLLFFRAILSAIPISGLLQPSERTGNEGTHITRS